MKSSAAVPIKTYPQSYATQGLLDALDKKSIDLVADEISKQTDKDIKGVARETVSYNAHKNKLRWARVPSGNTTCTFCLMLASQGFVYKSATRAGQDSKYHAHCDCIVVPGTKNTQIEGYDPDALYKRWKELERKEAIEEAQKPGYNKNKHAKEQLKREYRDEKLRQNIKETYNLKIRQGLQDKHIKETRNYNQEIEKGNYNSYLLDGINPQELVNEYTCTGEFIRDAKGNWTNKEKIILPFDTGYVYDDKNSEYKITNRMFIHYSKNKGTHIVPRSKDM